MLKRSNNAGVKNVIITGGSLHESKEALALAKQESKLIYSSCFAPGLTILTYRYLCNRWMSSYTDHGICGIPRGPNGVPYCSRRVNNWTSARSGASGRGWRMWPWLVSMSHSVFILCNHDRQIMTEHNLRRPKSNEGTSVRPPLHTSNESLYLTIVQVSS